MTADVKTVPKLIEVALPLDDINRAAVREKSIRLGHPNNLHLWWARRPLAAVRAVLFAQLVDDPSGRPELFPTESDQERERERLFGILKKLVLWESTTNEKVLEAARVEIRESWRRACADNADHPRAVELFDPEKLPAFHDPFAGGGAIPLEAQRLGLGAHASDLNPVAVLINKAMIEIQPKFAGKPPVNPEARSNRSLAERQWRGAAGLADDVRYYGKWMRDEAEKRIGHLYPKVRITPAMVAERPDLKRYEGRELIVIAWLWARTVPSPNPAFSDVNVPLVSTFMLSTKQGREAYVEPIVEKDGYRFEVQMGPPAHPTAAKAGTKLGRGASFRCLVSGSPIKSDYIKNQGMAGKMGSRLLAMVAEGDRQRVYLSPTHEMEDTARRAEPTWWPEGKVPPRLTGGTCVPYGLTQWGDLFTSRQLVALTNFSNLVGEAVEHVRRDAVVAGFKDDDVPLEHGGAGTRAYGEALGVYLAFAVSKQADIGNALCAWGPKVQCPLHLFARQAIPMVWDFAEGNPIGYSSGSFHVFIKGILGSFKRMCGHLEGMCVGHASQDDARSQNMYSGTVVSTDPPYYDNVSYADLSDFFYVWLRRSLRPFFPSLFSTLASPKVAELVATPHRHGGKIAAEQFFLDGMQNSFGHLKQQTHPWFPVTIYYAFKQSEATVHGGTMSTGWATFLDAVIRSGFSITGTWPLRTERSERMIGQGTNSLASSILLSCRKRPDTSPSTTRRGFLGALHTEFAPAIARLQAENIAPVDLAQAAIGPGMAIFTRYSRVIEADDSPMTVRMALALINAELDQILSAQDADYDSWTRFAVTWFETKGMEPGPYGDAETLATARGVAVQGVVEAGILEAKSGNARLLRRDELDPDWSPESDDRLTVWECAQHVARRLYDDGEMSAARLVGRLGDRAGAAHALAYRLYGICERKKLADEALIWNELVTLWPRLLERTPEAEPGGTRHASLYNGQ